MRVYTYSEARQKLASVLETAEATGSVVIRRRDGRSYTLVPRKTSASPLDVPSVQAKISTEELVKRGQSYTIDIFGRRKGQA